MALTTLTWRDRGPRFLSSRADVSATDVVPVGPSWLAALTAFAVFLTAARPHAEAAADLDVTSAGRRSVAQRDDRRDVRFVRASAKGVDADAHIKTVEFATGAGTRPSCVFHSSSVIPAAARPIKPPLPCPSQTCRPPIPTMDVEDLPDREGR
jgi:hypothetical protein